MVRVGIKPPTLSVCSKRAKFLHGHEHTYLCRYLIYRTRKPAAPHHTRVCSSPSPCVSDNWLQFDLSNIPRVPTIR